MRLQSIRRVSARREKLMCQCLCVVEIDLVVFVGMRVVVVVVVVVVMIVGVDGLVLVEVCDVIGVVRDVGVSEVCWDDTFPVLPDEEDAGGRVKRYGWFSRGHDFVADN